jgi:bacterioferritin-associated ferredoxin
MTVCVCHRVSDRDIARAARDGCASFDELQFELSVATACGKRHDCARETFHHHAAQAGASQTHPACGAHTKLGKLIPITAHQHQHHDQMASAIR